MCSMNTNQPDYKNENRIVQLIPTDPIVNTASPKKKMDERELESDYHNPYSTPYSLTLHNSQITITTILATITSFLEAEVQIK